MKRFILFFLGIAAVAQTIGNPQPVVYRVSQLIPASHASSGCNWLTGLRTGGSACYDDSGYINPILAAATLAYPVDLVFDVSIGTSVPLLIPTASTVTLEGIGSNATGIFTLSGSYTTPVCTYWSGQTAACNNIVAGSTPPAQSGSLVVRNLGINGHRGSTYPNTNSTVSGDLRCSPNWCYGMIVANLQYLEVSDSDIYDAPTFGIFATNIGTAVFKNVVVNHANVGANTDCIHLGGPIGNFIVDGATLTCYDDGIALNMPEGYAGNIGGGTISNVDYVTATTMVRTYPYDSAGHYTLGPVLISNVWGSLNAHADTPAVFRSGLGTSTPGYAADEIASIKIVGARFSMASTGNVFSISSNIGELSCTDCTWVSPVSASPWTEFTNSATVSNYVLNNATIYRNTTGSAAAFWGTVPTGDTITRHECNVCNVVNEQGQSYSALSYAWDVQSGGAIGTFVMTAMDPHLQPTLLNGNEWSRVASFYGAGVANYYRNTTYANLPPATYPGLGASISDSAAGGVWGAAESGGSAGHYAGLASNGTNWAVTGK